MADSKTPASSVAPEGSPPSSAHRESPQSLGSDEIRKSIYAGSASPVRTPARWGPTSIDKKIPAMSTVSRSGTCLHEIERALSLLEASSPSKMHRSDSGLSRPNLRSPPHHHRPPSPTHHSSPLPSPSLYRSPPPRPAPPPVTSASQLVAQTEGVLARLRQGYTCGAQTPAGVTYTTTTSTPLQQWRAARGSSSPLAAPVLIREPLKSPAEEFLESQYQAHRSSTSTIVTNIMNHVHVPPVPTSPTLPCPPYNQSPHLFDPPLETPRSSMNRLAVDQAARHQRRLDEQAQREQQRELARAEFLQQRHNGRRCHEAGRKMKWMASLKHVFEGADPHAAGIVTTNKLIQVLSSDSNAAALVGQSTASAVAQHGRFMQIFREVGVADDNMVDLLQFQNFCVKLSGSDGH